MISLVGSISGFICKYQWHTVKSISLNFRGSSTHIITGHNIGQHCKIVQMRGTLFHSNSHAKQTPSKLVHPVVRIQMLHQRSRVFFKKKIEGWR